MKKEEIDESLKSQFVKWLREQKGKDGEIRYSSHTVNTYIDCFNKILDQFCKRRDSVGWNVFARSIGSSVMCSYFCAMTLNTLKLGRNEIQYLAEAFWFDCAKNSYISKGDFLFKKNRFQKMIRFFYQNKLGTKYCRIVNLFFAFLKSINWDDNPKLYESVATRIEEMKRYRGFNLKYWYLEATQNTPALIMGKANQSKIPVSDLEEIMCLGPRTIRKILKDEGYRYLDKSDSFWIEDVNDFFLQKHSEFAKRYLTSVHFSQKQEGYIGMLYNYLLGKIGTLKNKNSLSNLVQRKSHTATILSDMNSYLAGYSLHLDNEKERWKGITEAQKMIKKPIRTIQRHGKQKKIPILSYSKRKPRYFCG